MFYSTPQTVANLNSKITLIKLPGNQLYYNIISPRPNSFARLRFDITGLVLAVVNDNNNGFLLVERVVLACLGTKIVKRRIEICVKSDLQKLMFHNRTGQNFNN